MNLIKLSPMPRVVVIVSKKKYSKLEDWDFEQRIGNLIMLDDSNEVNSFGLDRELHI